MVPTAKNVPSFFLDKHFLEWAWLATAPEHDKGAYPPAIANTWCVTHHQIPPRPLFFLPMEKQIGAVNMVSDGAMLDKDWKGEVDSRTPQH